LFLLMQQLLSAINAKHVFLGHPRKKEIRKRKKEREREKREIFAKQRLSGLELSR
jgi:guanylate kinase